MEDIEYTTKTPKEVKARIEDDFEEYEEVESIM